MLFWKRARCIQLYLSSCARSKSCPGPSGHSARKFLGFPLILTGSRLRSALPHSIVHPFLLSPSPLSPLPPSSCPRCLPEIRIRNASGGDGVRRRIPRCARTSSEAPHSRRVVQPGWRESWAMAQLGHMAGSPSPEAVDRDVRILKEVSFCVIRSPSKTNLASVVTSRGGKEIAKIQALAQEGNSSARWLTLRWGSRPAALLSRPYA